MRVVFKAEPHLTLDQIISFYKTREEVTFQVKGVAGNMDLSGELTGTVDELGFSERISEPVFRLMPTRATFLDRLRVDELVTKGVPLQVQHLQVWGENDGDDGIEMKVDIYIPGTSATLLLEGVTDAQIMQAVTGRLPDQYVGIIRSFLQHFAGGCSSLSLLHESNVVMIDRVVTTPFWNFSLRQFRLPG